MKKKLKIVGIVLLVALIAIQFIPMDKTNPESDPSQDIFQKFDADEALMTKIKDACYDCHSNHTEYPWYTRVQPVGWWIKGHINGGRKHLNFSEFVAYSDKKAKHKLEECIEYTEKKWMPLSSFTWTHSEAKLTELERSTMVTWFEEQFESYNSEIFE